MTLSTVRYETCKFSLVSGVMVYFEFEIMLVKFPKSTSRLSADGVLVHFIQSKWGTVVKLASLFVCKHVNFARPLTLMLMLSSSFFDMLGTSLLNVPIREKDWCQHEMLVEVAKEN